MPHQHRNRVFLPGVFFLFGFRRFRFHTNSSEPEVLSESFMTETRRAVPKGAALFISLFLPVSRLSSCSAARPIRSPLLHAPHLLPLPPPETAKDLPACPRLPILHLPAGSSARQTTATGTPLSPPPLPCAHRRSSSQRDRHGEELTRLVKEIRARRSSICTTPS